MAEDREKRLAREKAWRAENPDRVKEIARRWYEKNRQEVAASKRAWRVANPEKAKEASRKAHAQQRENRQLYAFNGQRDSAKRRGIPFLLTYAEWWSIWQASGHWEQRGLGSDQYCMARYGDAGAYELNNVRICTGRENRAEARKGKRLSEAHRAALVAAWERRRHRLPPLRMTKRGLPRAQGPS